MEASRIAQAEARHKQGYNCCQALVCTYCDLLGVDEQTAFRMAEGFGFGIAGMEQTCGTVSGMVLLAGLKNSDGNLETPGTKRETYKLGKALADEFLARRGRLGCAELRAYDREQGIRGGCHLRVRTAAQIVEERLFPGQFEQPEQTAP